jgi:hypothetical protein
MKLHGGILLAAFLVLCAAPAFAEPLQGQDHESRVLSDNWYFSLGWFGADISTDVAFGFGNHVGTSIRLEDELQLAESKDSARLGFKYRFNRKHAISLAAFSLNRSATSVIDDDIEIKAPGSDAGVHFNVGATIDSTLDADFLGLFYNYSFYNNGKIDAGINVGFSTYDFGLDLAGQAELIDEDGNPVGGTQFRSTSQSVVAPVPAYGIFINYAIRKNVIFTFTSQGLHLDVGDIEGRVSDTRGTVEWFVTRNFGFGGGVTNTSIEVKDNSDDPYRVDYNYGGFVFYFAGVF